MSERILAASYLDPTSGAHYDAPAGGNHDDASDAVQAAGRDWFRDKLIDGFVTSAGRFVTREEAAQLVKRPGRLHTEDIPLEACA